MLPISFIDSTSFFIESIISFPLSFSFTSSAMNSMSLYIPSILLLLGIYTTGIPASLTDLYGSSDEPTWLYPEAITISDLTQPLLLHLDFGSPLI